MRLDDHVMADARAGWAIVVPVKRLSHAKTRIAASGETSVESLAFAFAKDTATSALACPVVALVIVTTSDEQVEAWAVANGCLVVSDTGHPGINAAAKNAARTASARRRTAVLVSDLPCLTPVALASVLNAGTRHSTSFLADRQGTGTTIWMGGEGSTVSTRFGLGSRAAHSGAGAVDLAREQPDQVEWLTARHDVDTRDDLSAALRIGVGPHTAEAARMLYPA
jgi:2-phospho-L-lactate guanylyltransferase